MSDKDCRTYASEEDMRIRFGDETLAQLCPPDLPDLPGLPDPGGPEGAAAVGESSSFTDGGSADGGGPSLAAALADATELIDSYAAARYRVPLDPVPAPVRRWCADIARWYLDRARTDEAIRKAYEDAMAGLKDMARGAIVFQCRGVASVDTPNGQVLMSGPKRIFSAESMKGY